MNNYHQLVDEVQDSIVVVTDPISFEIQNLLVVATLLSSLMPRNPSSQHLARQRLE